MFFFKLNLFETKVDFIILMNVIFFLLLTKMAVNVSLFQIIVHPFCYFVIINILLNLYFETLISGHVINSTLAYFKFKNAELSKTTPHLVSSFESCDIAVLKLGSADPQGSTMNAQGAATL